MASKELKPIEQIAAQIKARNNFVLNGGAGSGKTSSLTEVIDLLYEENNANKIACITFTNVAADEITERTSRKKINLRASTIHDFLWDVIKNYQKNLKQILLELIQSGDISYSGEETLNEDWFKNKTIDYREWRKLEEGIVSHDEVLHLANQLFEKFPLLNKILSDKYDFILIDEYQDTEEQIIQIFLEHLQKIKNRPLIGLFGDSMQSIYNKGIGDLQNYVNDKTIVEIPKVDNWRCSKTVINLINKIRNDGLQQKPAGNNIEGKITFLYSNAEEIDIEATKKHEAFTNFNFGNHSENKELYLTHKLIAKQLGFENLLNSYKYTNNLIGDKPDKLAKHLLQIQEVITLYEEKKYNDFIRKTDFKIKKNSDLEKLKQNIETLKNYSEKTMEEMINLANELGLVQKDDKLQNFISEKKDQYIKVKDLQYSEIVSLSDYITDHSPYSTQHGVKGAEFNNVFVILDNGRWNQYNFTYLFEERADKETTVTRTRKIFYVCCSRAKENLVVLFHKPSSKVLNKAKEWFGEQNMIEV